MGAIYEVYIDVLAVNNFLVDLAALLAVNLYRRRNVRALRILAGALAGTLLNCLVFLALGHPAAYLLTVHFLVNPGIVYFCFREKSKQDFFSDLCIGYFMFILIGGTVEWLYAKGSGLLTYESALLAALFVLCAACLWFGRRMRRFRYFNAKIRQNGTGITLRALADSGNLLTDPYTGKHASMIDRRAYEAAFQAPQAVRLIPYESLGCRHGLLEAVTIEELSFVYDDQKKTVKGAVLCLVDHALFEKKPYQMIINPQETDAEGAAKR